MPPCKTTKTPLSLKPPILFQGNTTTTLFILQEIGVMKEGSKQLENVHNSQLTLDQNGGSKSLPLLDVNMSSRSEALKELIGKQYALRKNILETTMEPTNGAHTTKKRKWLQGARNFQSWRIKTIWVISNHFTIYRVLGNKGKLVTLVEALERTLKPQVLSNEITPIVLQCVRVE
jgi:hypothetical protein